MKRPQKNMDGNWEIFPVFNESPDTFQNVAVHRQNQRILVRYVVYGGIFGLPLAKPLTLIVLWT